MMMMVMHLVVLMVMMMMIDDDDDFGGGGGDDDDFEGGDDDDDDDFGSEWAREEAVMLYIASCLTCTINPGAWQLKYVPNPLHCKTCRKEDTLHGDYGKKTVNTM